MSAGPVDFPGHAPPPPLRPYVTGAHGYRVPANPAGLHRGLPSRSVTLVVELLSPLHVRGEGWEVAAHGVAGGLHTRPVLLDATRPQEGLQYGLTPLGAQVLLGVPAAELSGHTVDLAALLGRRAERLVAELQGAAGWRERFAVLDAALLRRLGDAPPASPAAFRAEVAEAWRVVFASDGRARVAEVAAHVGWSRRHLAERFAAATGITPKEAARIARFEAARGHLLAPARLPLADVAARCGYADQPHLAREWLALTGCSIGTWLREELPFVQDTAPGDAARLPA